MSISERKVRPQPSADIVAQGMQGSVVLLNIKTNLFYELNDTAARLWELLNTDQSLDEIHRVLLEEFEVDPDLLKSEVESTLDTFSAEGLVSNA